MPLNNEWVKNEIREEIKKVSGNKRKWTHNNPKLKGHSNGLPEREVHSDTGLTKKESNISNKWPNPTLTGTWGTKTKTTQSIRIKANNHDYSRIKWHGD